MILAYSSTMWMDLELSQHPVCSWTLSLRPVGSSAQMRLTTVSRERGRHTVSTPLVVGKSAIRCPKARLKVKNCSKSLQRGRTPTSSDDVMPTPVGNRGDPGSADGRQSGCQLMSAQSGRPPLAGCADPRQSVVGNCRHSLPTPRNAVDEKNRRFNSSE